MASPPPEPGLNGLVWNLHPFIQRTGLVHLPAHLRPPPGLQPREVDTARASGPSILKSTSQQDSHKYGGGRRAAWKLESTASHQTFFWLWQGPFRYIRWPAKRLVLFLRPMRNIQKTQNLIWCCIAAMVEIVRVSTIVPLSQRPRSGSPASAKLCRDCNFFKKPDMHRQEEFQ